jgi:hypothetical protein
VSDPERLLRAYIDAHNEGMTTGSFAALAALFADDGVLRFEGIPLGPFEGPAAIEGAFRDFPPDDELDLGTVEVRDEWALGASQWRDSGERAGVARLRARGGRIDELIIDVR